MNTVMSHSLSSVLERIDAAARRAGRDPRSVRLVVVTKGVPVERIREVISEGASAVSGSTVLSGFGRELSRNGSPSKDSAEPARILGENRIQEAIPKIEALGPGLSWHLIGSLQRNKARLAVGIFDLIHSVDRPELAEEIHRRAGPKGIRQKVLIQVNVAGEAVKHGVSVEEAMNLVMAAAALPNLEVQGLMTIPPLPDRSEDSRPHYRRLRELARTIEKETGITMRELSMGMSRDFEVAIEEGATLIRVGSAIFNPGG